MKLAQIVPEATVPVVRQPRAEVGASQWEGLRYVGRALQQGAADLAVAQERIAKAQDAKRKQLGEQEAHAAEATLETALATDDSDLRVTERDPEGYETALARTTRERVTEAARGLRTEEGRALFQQRLPRIVGKMTVTGRKHANALHIERGVGLLTQNLADLVRLSGLTPVGEDEEFEGIKARGLQAIDAAVPIIGHDKAAALRLKFDNDVTSEKARRHRDFDPEHFAEVADQKYPQMDPKQRDEFKEQARKEVIRLADRDRAERERQEKQIAEDHKLYRDGIFSDLNQLARQGTLDLRSLDEARQRYRMDDATYNRLRDTIEKKPMQPSNDAVVRDATLLVRSSRVARRDKERLAHWYSTGQLNRDDYNKLDEELTGNLRHLEDQDKAKWQDRHQQAEQMLATALTVTSPLEPINPTAQLARELALKDLTDRSKRYGGNDDPLAVAREILPGYQQMLKIGTGRRVDNLRSQIDGRYPTAEALEAAWQAKTIDASAYNAQRRLWIELRAAEQAVRGLDQKPKKDKSRQ